MYDYQLSLGVAQTRFTFARLSTMDYLVDEVFTTFINDDDPCVVPLAMHGAGTAPPLC
jgi:hypothetical protein